MPETDNQKQLQGAFGEKGTNVNDIAYVHPHADAILQEARAVLHESETGRSLLKLSEIYKIPVNILRGKGDSGYAPQAKVVYIQIPGKVKTAEPKTILAIVKALREAEQDTIGMTAPDPAKDMLNYAAVMHAKNLDSIVFMCKVVQELTDSSHFSGLFDALENLGHSNVYKAYVKQSDKLGLAEAYVDK